MFTTTLTTPGICITLSKLNSFCSASLISSRYRCFNRGSVFTEPSEVVISDVLAIGLGDADLLAGLVVDAGRHPGRLAVGVEQHHVADVDRRFLRDDAAGGGSTLGARYGRVLLDPVDALDEHLVAVREGHQDLALGALVLTGDHEHRVALVDVHLQHLRGERDDLHEALLAQLAADRAEDARATRIVVGLDEDGGVLVELDVAAVGAAALLDGADDDGLHYLAALDAAAGDGVLDGRHDDVADAGVTPCRAAEHADAQDLLGARVVGDLHPRFLLNHSISSTWLCVHGRFRPDMRGLAVSEGHAGFSMSACAKSIKHCTRTEVCPRQPVNSR